jgi:hypothetical protein
MNATLKTILLTVLALSIFAIALIELSGVSQKIVQLKHPKYRKKTKPKEMKR